MRFCCKGFREALSLASRNSRRPPLLPRPATTTALSARRQDSRCDLTVAFSYGEPAPPWLLSDWGNAPTLYANASACSSQARRCEGVAASDASSELSRAALKSARHFEVAGDSGGWAVLDSVATVPPCDRLEFFDVQKVLRPAGNALHGDEIVDGRNANWTSAQHHGLCA